MEDKLKSIAATILVTAAIVAILLFAPFVVEGPAKARGLFAALNGFASLATPASGPGVPVALVTFLGAALVLAQLRHMLPKRQQQEAPQPARRADLSRTLQMRPNKTGTAQPAPQARPRTLSELEDAAKKQLAPGEYWPTHDYIAWRLQGADRVTFRNAGDVLRELPHCEDVVLSDADFQEVQRLWAEKRRPTTALGVPPRPVLIAHKARQRDRDWKGSGSHFGGLPRLGETPWPRGKDGRPLPFVAQIDLAELARQCPETPLTDQGSLAFFINDGAVIHVPPGTAMESLPPPDLPHAFEECGYPLPERETLRTHRLFPYWPIDLIGLNLPAGLPPFSDCYDDWDVIWKAQTDAIPATLKKREFSFSVYSARKEGVASADLTFWYAAQLFHRQLRQALSESGRREAYHTDSLAKSAAYRQRLEAETPRNEETIAGTLKSNEYSNNKISAIRGEAIGLAEFVQAIGSFIAGRDPWQAMTAEEASVLSDAVREARSKFGEHCSYHTPHSLDDLRSATVKAMITGDDTAFAALPDDMLAFINDGYRLTSAAQHQMFGLGTCIQDALSCHLGDLLLLQIGYDDLPEFTFGDVGAFQFWIDPKHAAEGRWDRTVLTFECH